MSQRENKNIFGYKYGSTWDMLFYGRLDDSFRKASPEDKKRMVEEADSEMEGIINRSKVSDAAAPLIDQQKRISS